MALGGLLAQYLGQAKPPALSVDPRASRGWRPGRAGGPISFNLSHSGELALIAVAAGGVEVGVDVERLRTRRDPARLAARWLSEADAAAVAAPRRSRSARSLLRRLDPPRGAGQVHRRRARRDAARRRGRRATARGRPGYAGAVAFDRGALAGREPRIRRFRHPRPRGERRRAWPRSSRRFAVLLCLPSAPPPRRRPRCSRSAPSPNRSTSPPTPATPNTSSWSNARAGSSWWRRAPSPASPTCAPKSPAVVASRGCLIALAPDFDTSGRLLRRLHRQRGRTADPRRRTTAGGNTAPLSTLRQILTTRTRTSRTTTAASSSSGRKATSSSRPATAAAPTIRNTTRRASPRPLGKILRLDPDPNGVLPYTVPADNPFAAGTGWEPLVWSYGLRNPFRFSFDRTGAALVIGDVGRAPARRSTTRPRPASAAAPTTAGTAARARSPGRPPTKAAPNTRAPSPNRSSTTNTTNRPGVAQPAARSSAATSSAILASARSTAATSTATTARPASARSNRPPPTPTRPTAARASK